AGARRDPSHAGARPRLRGRRPEADRGGARARNRRPRRERGARRRAFLPRRYPRRLSGPRGSRRDGARARGARSAHGRAAGPAHRVNAALPPRALIAAWVAAGTLACGALLVGVAGASPFDAGAALFDGALGSKAAIGETLTRSTSLVLCALGAVLSFRAGVLNI